MTLTLALSLREREPDTAGGVGFDGRWLAEHAAQVVEVRLRRLAFLQLGRRPLGDELVRRHVVTVSPVTTPMPRNDTLSVGTVLVAGRRSALSVKASHILVVAVPKLAGS